MARQDYASAPKADRPDQHEAAELLQQRSRPRTPSRSGREAHK
jgi:hypothetical protein